MKILLLHDVAADKQNGVSVSLGILSRELKKSGKDVKVLTLADGTKSFKDGDNTCLSSIPALIYPGIRMRPLITNRYVDELIEWNPDIIHTNCEFSTFLTARYIHAHCEKSPAWIHTFHTDYKYYIGLLQNIHTIRDKFVPRFLNYCFTQCDALIVPTEKMRAYVTTSEFAKSINTKVIPTGIDFSELNAHAAENAPDVRAELGLDDSARIVLFLGRISAEKNLDELFDHFAAYQKNHPDVYLITVGDGPHKETLAKKVKKLGLDGKILLHDGVKHTDIRRFYDAADVFASASESETQGLTFYEALYCGVPVLAKDRECLEQAITEGVNGAFFSDEESFAASLDRILNLKRRNAGHPPATLPHCFESEYFAKSVAALYEETLRNRPERPAPDKKALAKLFELGSRFGETRKSKVVPK